MSDSSCHYFVLLYRQGINYLGMFIFGMFYKPLRSSGQSVEVVYISELKVGWGTKGRNLQGCILLNSTSEFILNGQILV